MAVVLVVAGFVGVAAAGVTIAGIISGAMEPVSALVRQRVWPLIPVQIPDPATAVVMRLKGSLSADEYQSILLKQGFDAAVAEQLFAAAEQIMTPVELAAAQFRGIIDQGRYDAEMSRLGFSTESAEDFQNVSKFIGGPADNILFAVREAFSPAIVSELGLDEDFPEEFAEAAKKLGFDEDVDKLFWRSHWVLPSVQQGFEMLHRKIDKDDGGVFTEDDMLRLLRIQDVMPFFRNMIVKIAFRPFTRVDVRRMFRIGILSQDEVQTAYEDLGFDEEKAEKMTQFTVRFETQEERALTKSEILRAMTRDVITPDIARELLTEIGTSGDAAEIIIATVEAKAQMDLTDDLIDIEIGRFIDGLQNEDELIDALSQVDVVAPQLELILAKARRRRRSSQKMPSRADVVTWWDAGRIADDKAFALLAAIGIKEEFIPLYLNRREALPTRANIVSWFQRKLIDKDRATELLLSKGYAAETVTLMLDSPQKVPGAAVVQRWLRSDLIQTTQADELLTELDFAPDLRTLFIEEALAKKEEGE